MREIKFRAWDKSMKKYHYPKLWDNSMPTNWEDWYILQQFTGLHDKHGKPIYEGDKIMPSTLNRTTLAKKKKVDYHVVKWGRCEWVAEGYNGDMLVSPNLSYRNDWEVIGNIYEEKQ